MDLVILNVEQSFLKKRLLSYLWELYCWLVHIVNPIMLRRQQMGYEVVFFVLHLSISFCCLTIIYLFTIMLKKMKDQRNPQSSLGTYGIYWKAVLSLVWNK